MRILVLPLVAACVNTTGRFDDLWRSGNDDTKTLAIEHHEEKRPDGFKTTVTRASNDKKSPLCYYTAQNLCVKGGALMFLDEQSSEGKLRLCNDLRSRIRVGYEAVHLREEHKMLEMSSTPVHVVSCWQLYGYHLYLCILAAWYLQQQHDFPLSDMWLYNHASSMPREVRLHYSMSDFFGSPSNWSDPHHPHAAREGYSDSHYWGLWSVVAPHPSKVRKLRRPYKENTGDMMCYKKGLIGIVSPLSVPANAKRLFTNALRLKFGITQSPRACGGTRNALLVIRQKGRNQGLRTITNPQQVMGALRELKIMAKQVSFEDIPLAEQLKHAAGADIFISSHGGGNTWLTLMRERSVFIECWLDYPRRLVYVNAARSWNIRYYHISEGKDGSAYLEKSVHVPIQQLTNTLANALNYLNVTSCCS